MKKVIIYTARGNPGPGGYGAVLIHTGEKKEISEGYKLTTNNRMELMACIAGLQTLKYSYSVVIYTDSRYIADSMEKGWVRKWEAQNWKRNKKDKAENVDLWEKLLNLCTKHKVKFEWIKGHSGIRENERCDELANKAVSNKELKEDTNYINNNTTFSQPHLF
ncbi:ribonuclease HI [candidate division KSB1 bacterium]